MNKYEDFIAGMEASRNSACEDYFSARPMLDVTREKEKIFEAGFERAYKQQAETIERLKQGMKGDYDLDQWLDWAVSKKHMMETIERLNSRNKRLLNAMNTMRDDLPAGAPEAEDGTVFINVKIDVWEYFCAVIDNTENKLEAGEL